MHVDQHLTSCRHVLFFVFWVVLTCNSLDDCHFHVFGSPQTLLTSPSNGHASRPPDSSFPTSGARCHSLGHVFLVPPLLGIQKPKKTRGIQRRMGFKPKRQLRSSPAARFERFEPQSAVLDQLPRWFGMFWPNKLLETTGTWAVLRPQDLGNDSSSLFLVELSKGRASKNI